jgi:hypothetical protein
MGAVLREVIIDCNNPRLVAEFWSAVLGWDVQETGEVVWMSESGAPFPDLLLVFCPVTESKTVKNRVHLDVSPVGCDRDEEVARLETLGATRIDIGQGEQGWVVLADPEGNEFCVLGRRADVT